MDIDLRVAKPFQTLDELYDGLDNLKPWPNVTKLRESAEYVYTTSEINEKGKIIALPKVDREKQPRTIICHDMKGGYLQDNHYMVTIPPYGWINAAHNNGVKVLGTVITERIDGEHIWEKVLSSIEETKRFADALISLAKFYNFEGWLLNIENKIKPNDISRLLYFIQYLTAGIHTQIQASEIIWYDSVTIDGDLKWQNELNDLNKCFLDNCDGIFLNYNWTDIGLTNSKILAAQSGKIRNIFVGLDVWGRGCPGGGGFNSVEALRKIRKHNLSVAIFGAAWTHEFFNGESFQKIEDIFWAQLSSLMYIHVPIYDNENFVTSFCRGSGRHYYKNGIGNQHVNSSFYNLTLQQIQISVPAIHLTFTHKDENNKSMSNNNDKIEKTNEHIYETAFDVMTVRGNTINLQEKYHNDGDNIHHVDFNNKFSYDGEGCLELVSGKNVFQSYHRLFLIHFEFDTDIQIIVIHQKQNDSVTDTLGDDSGAILNFPTVIFINHRMEKHLVPYKNRALTAKWWKSYYHAVNIKTINEIGIVFTSAGRHYIGKVQVQPISNHRQLLQDK